MKNYIVFAGKEVHAEMEAEANRIAPLQLGLRDSEVLSRLQKSQSKRGYIGVELVNSAYGWSVRYDSGTRDFGLLAGARRGNIDGSLKSAIDWATRWVEEDPAHRYASGRKSDLESSGGNVLAPATI
ncbi:hypothetical protein [Duganella vulcania]|uniref:Uncharacterized protein n=1 Tax=Duganella vulcania TaxID=2692166 RepID=A0A845GGZ5_9BURK|nr:hypothetical protein [Duganella vulcania]MYM92675.1 hypothetical protein [Duganella vulcania]